MPYIHEDLRPGLQSEDIATTSGELAYLIYAACLDYIDDDVESFGRYAQVLGVLEAVKLELHRRRLAPYEETKKLENGDVFSATELALAATDESIPVKVTRTTL